VSEKAQRLKKEARLAAQRRGHYLDPFHQVANHLGAWDSSCVKCGRGVQVRLYPLPNEIQIGGECVALDCDGEVRVHI